MLTRVSGPFGALNKTLPGYSGYISETLREEQEGLRDEGSSAHVVPRPPIENSYKFVTVLFTRAWLNSPSTQQGEHSGIHRIHADVAPKPRIHPVLPPRGDSGGIHINRRIPPV